MTLVLITNDDGIDAPGLHRLAVAVAAAGYDVVVAAPSAEASGSGAALTAVTEDGRIVVEKRELIAAPGLAAYAVGASPAYIALLATIGAFRTAPDLVLSGINRGANAGHAVLHSGTVGAALTAAQSGCRAMAVSLDVLFPAAASGSDVDAAIAAFKDGQQTRHWDTAADLAVDLLPELAGTPAGTVLNLNVPDAPPERLRGVRRGTLGGFGQVQMAVAETGEGFVRTTVAENGDRPRPGTDVAWLADGYACVGVVRGVVDVPDLPLRLPADPDGAAPT